MKVTSVPSSPSDVAKWSIVFMLTIAGVIANYHFHDVAWPLRLAGWVVLSIIVLLVAFQTTQGRRFLTFAKDARMELRKVDWPSRQETIQFTVGVVVMVMIMSLVLWLIDTALLWVVKWFTG